MSTPQTQPRANTEGGPDPWPLFELLSKVRRLLRASWVSTGAGIAVGLFAGVTLVFALLDLAVPLWVWLRWVAFACVAVPTAWVGYTGVLRPLVRRMSHRMVARRVERELPGIHNRLLSCVDLAEKHSGATRGCPTDAAPPASPEFYRRLVSEALERIRGFRPASVVDLPSLRRAAAAAGLTLMLFLLAWFVFSDRLPTALARIFRPWADIPPATAVKFTVRPGSRKVLKGDDVRFQVDVLSQKQPDELRLEIVPADGSPRLWYPLRRRGSRWTHVLQGYEKSFSYRVHGGGTWSPRYQITMVDRPRITGISAAVYLPKYMRAKRPLRNPPQVLDVTGPEQSQVELRVDVEGSAVEGEILLGRAARRQVEVPEEERRLRVWFSDALPEGAVAEGNWQWEPQAAGRKAHSDPAGAEFHHHLFHSAARPFVVQEGEHLFAWVYIVPAEEGQAGAAVESLMLLWHDGEGWEHRAFWGADRVNVGQLGTASRYRVGDLPPAGKWVRLEVPAAAVGLEGKSLRGMGFAQFGGQAYWQACGTLSPRQASEEVFEVVQQVPLRPVKQRAGQWIGRFPLVGQGLYRVELRNEMGAPNQTMKEAHYLAVADEPPQVMLERPGSDLVLSQPQAVPLVISVYDDFALADVTLLVQKGDTGSFQGRKIKQFKRRVRGETLAHTLNLAEFQLQPGEFIRYRVQCRDRKDQIAQTQDFTIRLAADENAADRQLARFEEAQDSFQQRLAQLIAEQTKVSEALETLAADYQPLEETLERARAESQAAARAAAQQLSGNAAQQSAPAQQGAPIQLDAPTVQQLAELQQRLAQLAAQEQQYSQHGQQLAAELGQAVQQAQQLDLLVPELAAEMAAAQQAFEQLAAHAMQQLAQAMHEHAQAAQAMQQQSASPASPRLGDLARLGQRVQQELEAVAERLAALDRARTEQARGELEAALAQLRRDLLQQRGAAAARGLADLKAALEALRQRLENLESRQAALMRDAEVVSDALLPEVAEHQQQLDAEAEPTLDQAERLLAADQKRRPRQPRFPAAPYEGEGEEYLVPPAEEDTPPTPEELAAMKQAADAQADGDAARQQQSQQEEQEEPLYEPALGGDRPRLDPRFADMLRPVEQQDQAAQADAPARQERQQLARHQRGRLQELNLSKQAVASDAQSLESLLAQLEQALDAAQASAQASAPDPAGKAPAQSKRAPAQSQGEKGRSKSAGPVDASAQGSEGQPSEPQQGPPAESQQGQSRPPEMGEPALLDEAQARQLAALLNSPLFEQALAMLERLQQFEQTLASQSGQQNQAVQPGQPSSQPPSGLARGALTGNMAGTRLGMAIIERELAHLDPATRTVILKLPPRVREELLQGMQEQGPEGYQEFIRDYFRRLSTLKAEGEQ